MRFPGIVALAFLAFAAPTPAFLNGSAVARERVPVECGPDSYINVSGHCVHRPVRAPTAPAGA